MYERPELGAYFRACNATPDTGIAAAVTTSFSATAALMAIVAGTTKKVIPHYLRLRNSEAGASTTSSRMAIISDTGDRYSSGGTNILTNAAAANGTGAASTLDTLYFGAITAAAAVAPKILSNFQVKVQASPCWIVGDEVLINFMPQAISAQALNGSTAQSIVRNVGPVVLAPSTSLVFHMWNVANATTPPSWEVEFAWWER